MQILTYGTSGMDTLPHDPSMLDTANVEYSYDPSTSHEKEDVDNITVPLARVGALLKDTEINYAPLEVNFGADKNSGQSVNSEIRLSADAYHATGNLSYDFSINGTSVQNSSSNSFVWTPDRAGTYTLSVKVTDADGKTATATTEYVIAGDAPAYELGDVNLDGKVNVADATLLQKYCVRTETFNETQLSVADVNKDGKIDISDATQIQRIVAQLV